MSNSSSLIGVVLCGGKSTRMGSDKGLLVKDEKIWAQIISDLFIQLKIPFAVSCREEQVSDYKKYFPVEKLITDKFSDSPKKIEGPLTGILSIHSEFPEKDLLIVACDMIQMSEKVLALLISEYKKNPDKDIYCYRLNENTFVEPLCAIYPGNFLQKLLNDFQSGKQIPARLQQLVQTNRAYIIPTNDNFAFSNFNS